MMLTHLNRSRLLDLPARIRNRAVLFAGAVGLLALGLTACNPGQGTVAGGAVGGIVVAAGIDLPAIQAACQKYGPIVNTAGQQTAGAHPSSIAGKISATAAFGTAFCAQVQAGSVPATANSNSVSWLAEIVGMIKALAPLAQIVIPLL
jgi:hypothetical protein